MDWTGLDWTGLDGLDWILLRRLVLLEHLAMLIIMIMIIILMVMIMIIMTIVGLLFGLPSSVIYDIETFPVFVLKRDVFPQLRMN